MENQIIANPQQWQSVPDCLKATYQLTGTVYTNVCDGTVHRVPFGALDYIGILFVVAFAVVMFFAFWKLFRI